MTTNPLFSIVTITRNNREGLIATHKSLPHGNYEWIVIDGDSSDGTKEYLLSVPAHSMSEPDSGIYNAMNKGLAMANGQYVIFMNAGDRFSDPDILSTLKKIIAAESPDFIYGDALESSGFYKKARHNIAGGMITHHQAMVYKRPQIKYNEEYRIAGDYDFTLRFLKQSKTIHYIPCAICIFSEGGISQQRSADGRREEFIIRRRNGISIYVCLLVYMRQAMSAWIKSISPALYRRMRKLFDNSQSASVRA